MSLAKSPRQYMGVRAILPPDLQTASRSPTASDTQYVMGTLWLNKTAHSAWMFTGSGGWIELGSSSSGDIISLTGSSGGAITPVSGNITLAAGTGMLSTAGTAGTITFNVNFASPPAIGSGTPAAITGTTVTSTTTMTAGTGLTVTTGNLAVSAGNANVTGNVVASKSAAGANVTVQATNSDNTSGTSNAGVEIAVGGASGGDSYLSFQISGVGASTMTMGLDNSASDTFVISNSATLGTSNALTLTQAGDLGATTSITAGTSLTATLGNITATNGNIVKGTAGNKDVYTSVGSGTAAGANSAGTVTLAGGTATVSTTAVTASSLIRIYRQGIGSTGAAALGILTIGTITASTSFVINAVQAADATALQASDVSVVFWEIVN